MCAGRRSQEGSGHKTHMHSVVLLKALGLFHLAHHDDDGGGASEEGISRSLVGLPGIDKVGDALLEELVVDLDGLRHDDCTRLQMPPR